MSEWLEIVKEFSIENIGILILISFAVISAAASYIQLLYASQFEAVLMNKNKESKRFILVYAILFFFLGITNYLLTMNASDIVNITLHFFLKDVRSMQHPVMNHSIVVS